MAKVKLSTELPLPAEEAAALARKPELMRFVLSPVLQARDIDIPETIEVGTHAAGRFWWFGVIPGWTHHITVRRLEPMEIYTNEHGGPVKVWNHRLTFEPIDDHRCRYTDEIEVEDGLRGAPTRAFIRLMFAHRHRRWRRLAAILA